MARAFLRCFVFCCLVVPVLALQAATPPALPEWTGLVVDQTGTLDEDAQSRLLRRLGALQNSGRAQVAILVASDTQGLPLADFSLQIAQRWKLGHAGRDDGMLILVVPSQNAARIEVGYGLEGTIPDVRAAQWIDQLLLPALKDGQLAAALEQVLVRIDAVLPPAQAPRKSDVNVLDQHPEWKLPFVLAVFSPIALFPLFLGRSGAWVSAPLFAAFIAGAALALWSSPMAAAGAGILAFLLPPLWGLNRRTGALPKWLRYARLAGNFAAVAIFFVVITTFVGVGLSGVAEEVWAAPLFAGPLALGLAVFLFPGKPAQIMMVVLRSVMHFVFVLLIAYLALQEFIPHPVKLSFEIAGAFTALVALSLFMDSREARRRAEGKPVTQWSLWLMGLALLVALPVGGLLLVQSLLGEDLHTRLAQAAAGGGSLGSVLWWAARNGLFSALSIGLGGKFGGGGAEGRG
jgi:uncharacterized protein